MQPRSRVGKIQAGFWRQCSSHAQPRGCCWNFLLCSLGWIVNPNASWRQVSSHTVVFGPLTAMPISKGKFAWIGIGSAVAAAIALSCRTAGRRGRPSKVMANARIYCRILRPTVVRQPSYQAPMVGLPFLATVRSGLAHPVQRFLRSGSSRVRGPTGSITRS